MQLQDYRAGVYHVMKIVFFSEAGGRLQTHSLSCNSGNQ